MQQVIRDYCYAGTEAREVERRKPSITRAIQIPFADLAAMRYRLSTVIDSYRNTAEAVPISNYNTVDASVIKRG